MAALILLAGAALVFGVGFIALLLLMGLISTALNILRVAFLSAIFAPPALAVMAAFLYYVPIARVVHWQPLISAQSAFRQALRQAIAGYLARTSRERTRYAIGYLVVLVIVTTIPSLWFSGRDSWDRLSGRLPPMLAPVGRVGRIQNVRTLHTIGDIAEYDRLREARIAETAARFVSLSNNSGTIATRCGTTSVPRPPELRHMAEFVVDLSDLPPIRKHEYLFTEEELTGVIATVMRSTAGAPFLLDCVELRHGYVKAFVTMMRGDSYTDNWAFGFVVTKEVGASLRVVLDEVSIGWVSLQLGWLGGGAIGGGIWGLGARSSEMGHEISMVVDAVDSRVYSADIREGYVSLVTWRLPSVVAARAASDVGHVVIASEYLVAPDPHAEALGSAAIGEIVYVVRDQDAWVYVCSETNGRFGWIPRAAFSRLE